jgi:hypothetical protein
VICSGDTRSRAYAYGQHAGPRVREDSDGASTAIHRQRFGLGALGASTEALTVVSMTNTTDPTTLGAGGTKCRHCDHDVDAHVLVLVVEDPPCGLVLCPESGCTCGATFRASGGRSTPEEISETRILVRQELERAGVPIPDFLR